MIIKNSEFKTSLKSGFESYNVSLPEIALVGRSNVGKSSLVNLLTNNSKLAKVSKTPGKTRLVNYFLINGEFYLVDLPGYGYAGVSKDEKSGWEEMMTAYFRDSACLKVIFILMDIRRDPSVEDMAMIALSEYYSIPYVILATKADKVAKSKRKNQAARLKRIIARTTCELILPVSSLEKAGKEELAEVISSYLSQEEP